MTAKAPSSSGWYAIGFLDQDEQMQWDSIYYFDGQTWSDENGDEVTSLYDPSLQMSVAMDAADGYELQGGTK